MEWRFGGKTDHLAPGFQLHSHQVPSTKCVLYRNFGTATVALHLFSEKRSLSYNTIWVGRWQLNFSWLIKRSLKIVTLYYIKIVIWDLWIFNIYDTTISYLCKLNSTYPSQLSYFDLYKSIMHYIQTFTHFLDEELKEPK